MALKELRLRKRRAATTHRERGVSESLERTVHKPYLLVRFVC